MHRFLQNEDEVFMEQESLGKWVAINDKSSFKPEVRFPPLCLGPISEEIERQTTYNNIGELKQLRGSHFHHYQGEPTIYVLI